MNMFTGLQSNLRPNLGVYSILRSTQFSPIQWAAIGLSLNLIEPN